MLLRARPQCSLKQVVRGFATAAKSHDTGASSLRNMALVAHIGEYLAYGRDARELNHEQILGRRL